MQFSNLFESIKKLEYVNKSMKSNFKTTEEKVLVSMCHIVLKTIEGTDTLSRETSLSKLFSPFRKKEEQILYF